MTLLQLYIYDLKLEICQVCILPAYMRQWLTENPHVLRISNHLDYATRDKKVHAEQLVLHYQKPVRKIILIIVNFNIEEKIIIDKSTTGRATTNPSLTLQTRKCISYKLAT